MMRQADQSDQLSYVYVYRLFWSQTAFREALRVAVPSNFTHLLLQRRSSHDPGEA